MTLPLHKDAIDKQNPRRCENCRFWAQWLQERILGTCGHRDHGGCTDKWETCVDFEEKA